MLALPFQISIFDFWYNKIDPFYDIISLEVVWDNFRISRPEIDIFFFTKTNVLHVLVYAVEV